MAMLDKLAEALATENLGAMAQLGRLSEDLSDLSMRASLLNEMLPKQARWRFLQDNAKQPTIGQLVDDAMVAIEDANPRHLKGVLPKDYARPALNKQRLGELIDLIEQLTEQMHGAADVGLDGDDDLRLLEHGDR